MPGTFWKQVIKKKTVTSQRILCPLALNLVLYLFFIIWNYLLNKNPESVILS